MILRTLARLASPERGVRAVLERCDVRVGGDRPWDLRVHDRALYWRLALDPGFELGETYMDGLWDCDAIDEMLFRLVKGGVTAEADGARVALRAALSRVWNRQSRARATQVTDAHYDLGVDVYEATLDRSLTYTCAVWAQSSDEPDTLEAAQERKLAAICAKLDLRPGERLLDIGCGFGGLAAFAAERRGVQVLAITNSRDHARIARERCARLSKVEVAQLDYRELPALGRRFDKVASIEMIEAVGPKNYDRFMDVVQRGLAPDGLFLLQSFISPWSVQRCNAWFDRYIFPNGVSPSMEQLGAAAAPRFGAPALVDDMGAHYPPTLLAWDRNFTAAWPRLRARYSERFRRMWHFYLTCLAGVFRAGDLSVSQVLYRAPSLVRAESPQRRERLAPAG